MLQADELIAMGNRLKKVFDEDFKKVFRMKKVSSDEL